MKITRREQLAMLGAASLSGVAPLRALASDDATASEPQTHIVEMLNVHPEDKKQRMVYVPDILQVNVGDTVKFVNADRGHNSQCDEEGAPEGGTLWNGKINEEVEVTIEVAGTYTYDCKPHRSAGMVGLLLVGDASVNYEAAKGQRFRGKSKKRYEDIFERADAMMSS